MNWIGKFENRCSAYGRCPEIFKLVPRSSQKKLGLDAEKGSNDFFRASVLWRHYVLQWLPWFLLKKKGMIKLNERCSFIVTVKYLVIVVQSFADIATTSSKGRNEQVESALFSRHERENTCTYFHVSLVFLSNFLIRKLQIVWQVQRCWMCILSTQLIASDIALKRLSFCASRQQTHAYQNKLVQTALIVKVALT